jgi:hypothetical protein
MEPKSDTDNEIKNESIGDPLAESLTCKICKMTFNGQTPLNLHLKGKKHQKNEKRHNKAIKSTSERKTASESQSNDRVTFHSTSEEPSSDANRPCESSLKKRTVRMPSEEPHELKSIPQGEKRSIECHSQPAQQPEGQTCFICDKSFTTNFHFVQHTQSRAHEAASVLVQRGATLVVQHLSFYMNSRARPLFTNEQHQSEAQEEEEILQLCDGKDQEQLQSLITLRRTLNDIEHEGRTQSQWNNFLTTILESSFNRSFAPPQDITPNLGQDLEDEDDLAWEDDHFDEDDPSEYY